MAVVNRNEVRNQLTLGTLKLARIRALKLGRVFSIARLPGPVPQGSVGAFHRFLLNSSYDAAPRMTGNLAKRKS